MVPYYHPYRLCSLLYGCALHPVTRQNPLVLHRVGIISGSPDNDTVTYINIDLDSGVTPVSWQSRVGTMIAALKDKRLLLPHYVKGVWVYYDRTLDCFGYVEVLRRTYNRGTFER